MSLYQRWRRIWTVFRFSTQRFVQMDGSQWAGAFAFNVFFSLFPGMILLVTLVSLFMDPNEAVQTVVNHVEGYVPLNTSMKGHIFDVIEGVFATRNQVGLFALILLVWSTLRCFNTLVRAINHAWGERGDDWWRLPLKSLVLLSITSSAIIVGILTRVMMGIGWEWILPWLGSHWYAFGSWLYALGGFLVPMIISFLGITLCYQRALFYPKRWIEVWAAALCTTFLLQIADHMFIVYLKSYATINAIYGSFGSIMALLLWIYLSGCILIFGACLCAGQHDVDVNCPSPT